MGVDWVPSRPRPGVDVEELRTLVARQAALVRAAGRVPVPGGDDDVRDDGMDAAAVALRDVAGRLAARLDLAVDAATRNTSCFRAAVVGGNALFPVEWRSAAWVTLLPEAAAEAVARWRWWYAHLLAGRMGHYLRRLRAWDAGNELAEVQAALVASARATLPRSNAWTRADRFVRAREGVLGLAAPPAVPPPGTPPASPAADGPTPDQEERLGVLLAHVERVRQAAREFNAAVPAGFRVRCGINAPDPGAPVRDEWLEAFFVWVDPVVESGQGLYLWA